MLSCFHFREGMNSADRELEASKHQEVEVCSVQEPASALACLLVQAVTQML